MSSLFIYLCRSPYLQQFIFLSCFGLFKCNLSNRYCLDAFYRKPHFSKYTYSPSGRLSLRAHVLPLYLRSNLKVAANVWFA